MPSIHRLRPSRRANEAVDEALSEAERAAMIAAATMKFSELFDVLHIDHDNDHNTRDTPRRVARMFVDEILQGRFSSPPILTDFENVGQFDQLIVTGPIDIRSTCAHHLMPIYGEAFIGVLPAVDGKIIGLSKYDRIVQVLQRSAADPGGAGKADRSVHHGQDCAPWRSGAHQRGAHV